MTSMEVRLDRTRQAGREDGVHTYLVQGAPDEPFHAALGRAVGEPLFGGWSRYCGDIEVRIQESPDWAMIPIDHQATLAQVAQFAGGAPLPMALVGRGGTFIDSLFDYLNAGLTLAGVADLLRRGHAALNEVLRRHERTAARRWVVAGTDSEPAMDLVQYVRTERVWGLDHFAGYFALDRAEAAMLLRRLGYVPKTPDGAVWEERPES